MKQQLNFTVYATSLLEAHGEIFKIGKAWFGESEWTYSTYASNYMSDFGGGPQLYEVDVTAQMVEEG